MPEVEMVVDHRRLFSALSSGWMQPGDDGVLVLGVEAPAIAPPTGNPGRHSIPVRLKIDADQLPNVLVSGLRRDGEWTRCGLDECAKYDAVAWQGALPTFAIASCSVPSDEQQARLKGMARNVSNIELDVPVTVETESGHVVDPPDFDSGMPCVLVAEQCDRMAGMLTMDRWATEYVKRTCDEKYAGDYRAPVGNSTFEGCLWSSALTVLSGDNHANSLDLMATIAETAERANDGAFAKEAADWYAESRAVYRTERSWEPNDQEPIANAVLYALMRRTPDRIDPGPDTPLVPTVMQAAARLCGWVNGYTSIPVEMRGDARTRRENLILAYDQADTGVEKVVWPNAHEEHSRSAFVEKPDGLTR